MEQTKQEYMKAKRITDDKPFMQLRQGTGMNYMHIQVCGQGRESEMTNREYGFADKFSAPPVVCNAIANHAAELYPSLATDSVCYYRDVIEVCAYTDGAQLRIKVPSADCNDGDTFVLELPAMRFGPFVQYLDDVGLLKTDEGVRFTQSRVSEEE